MKEFSRERAEATGSAILSSDGHRYQHITEERDTVPLREIDDSSSSDTTTNSSRKNREAKESTTNSETRNIYNSNPMFEQFTRYIQREEQQDGENTDEYNAHREESVYWKLNQEDREGSNDYIDPEDIYRTMKRIVRKRRARKQGKRPVEYGEELPSGKTDRRSVTVKTEEEKQDLEDLATVRYAQYQSALTYARKYEMERYGATLIPPEENRNQVKDVREAYIPRKRVQIPPVQSKAARIVEPLTAEEGDISDAPISRKKIRPEKQVKHKEELLR